MQNEILYRSDYGLMSLDRVLIEQHDDGEPDIVIKSCCSSTCCCCSGGCRPLKRQKPGSAS